MHVCDWANHRVQVFSPDGTVVTSLYGDAQELSKWAKMTLAASPDAMKRRREVRSPEREWRFSYPTAVIFDEKHGRVIVSDTQRNRLADLPQGEELHHGGAHHLARPSDRSTLLRRATGYELPTYPGRGGDGLTPAVAHWPSCAYLCGRVILPPLPP